MDFASQQRRQQPRVGGGNVPPDARTPAVLGALLPRRKYPQVPEGRLKVALCPGKTATAASGSESISVRVCARARL